jgi:AraC family transcriptional activator of mtrCDE
MDVLSKFLLRNPISTNLDWRCELQAPWRLENLGTPYGTVPYHLVVYGQAWLELESHEPISLSSGDIVMLPKGSPHILYAGDRRAPLAKAHPPKVTALGTLKGDGLGAETTILCGEFLLDPQISGLLLQSFPQIVLLKTENKGSHEHLHNVLQLLQWETKEQRLGAENVVSHLSAALFSLLMRGWLGENNVPASIFQLIAEPRLQPIAEHLLTHLNQSISIKQMSQLCFMSRATFMRSFKRITGHTPASLITSLRISEAVRLLKQSDLSVKVVSEKVGYSSEQTFHRVFKQKTGASPGEFRRKANRL